MTTVTIAAARLTGLRRAVVAACNRARARLTHVPGSRPGATAPVLPVPARPAEALPADLSGFRGPASGIVKLPVRLFWSGDREFDLGAPGDPDLDVVAAMYEPLFAKGTPADLAQKVNGELLPLVWDRIPLPPRKRALMESRYPQLGRSRLADAA